MKARQLEQKLVLFGAPVAPLDAIMRLLRLHRKLQVRGRGLHAPDIDAGDAAWIMAVLAGSDAGARAVTHMTRLAELWAPPGTSAQHGSQFIIALKAILSDANVALSVEEVRVCRNLDLATIIYQDGSKDRFVRHETFTAVGADAITDLNKFGSGMFRNEGVLSGGLLHQVAYDLARDRQTGEADQG